MSETAAILDAVLDDRLAIVGESGSGKTYAAKGLLARMVRQGARVVVIDPLGVWWGLRAGADGSPTGGLPMLILGGDHADVPLELADAEALGRAVGRSHVQCIVDLKRLPPNRRRREFVLAFLQALQGANQAAPLHLVLDEADVFAPQRALSDVEVELAEVVGEIVRQGRVEGFRPWVITQRPARLNKDVLSQTCRTLIAMGLPGAEDRAAIAGYVKAEARGKELLQALPALPTGEGIVWSARRGIFQRLRFPRLDTFDSSRTPPRGQAIAGPNALAPIDATALAAALADARGPASAEQERRGSATGAGAAAAGLAAAREEGLRAGRAEGEAERAALRQRIASLEAEIETAAASVAAAVEQIQRALPRAAASETSNAVQAPPTTAAGPEPPPAAPSAGAGAELRILRVLAQRHPAALSEAQWATLAGMQRKGGTWGTYKSRLRTRRLIQEQHGGGWTCTEDGLAAVGGVPAQPQTAAEVLATWKRALGTGPARMLDALRAKGGRMARAPLAEACGVAVSGGTFGTYLARLRSNGLVTTPAGGLVVLVEDLRR